MLYFFLLFLFIAVKEEEEPASKVPKFTPFTGSGKRLDGKAQTQTEPEDTKQQEKPTENGKYDEKLSVTTPRQRSGKLVFGSNSKPLAAKETVKVLSLLSRLFHLCDSL